jgi:CDP-diacylglycerol--serine O-phosphatidyltransferase
MAKKDAPTSKPSKGIYLLPNLFTTAAIFAGFYAIVASMDGRFESAAIAIFVAMIMDGLDGRVARLTNTQSDFGVQYDSLSDMVSFGLAPSLVLFQWGLSDLGKLGWFAAFVYTATAALRLARFNTRVGVVDKCHFQGLASPAAAAVLAGFVWVAEEYGLRGSGMNLIALVLTVGAGLLMVSNILYRSFKDLDLKGKVPFVVAVVVVLVFAVVLIQPPLVLFAIAFAYALSGPATALFFRNRKIAESPGDSLGEGQKDTENGDDSKTD